MIRSPFLARAAIRAVVARQRREDHACTRPLALEIIRAWTPSPRPRRCTALRAHPAFKQKKDPKYSLEAAVEAGEAAQRAPRAAVLRRRARRDGRERGRGARRRRGAVPRGMFTAGPEPGARDDVPLRPVAGARRRPGAAERDPAPRDPRRVPLGGRRGDGGARALDVEGCSFCGLSSAPGAGKDPAGVVKRVFGKAPDVPDCVLVVRPRNSVGDPSTRGRHDSTQRLRRRPGRGASVVLLNPDLGMKVALGIHQKDRWAAFVRSFAPAYHFSNWCSYESVRAAGRSSAGSCGTRTGQWEASTRSRSWILSRGDLKRRPALRRDEGAPPVPLRYNGEKRSAAPAPLTRRPRASVRNTGRNWRRSYGLRNRRCCAQAIGRASS